MLLLIKYFLLDKVQGELIPITTWKRRKNILSIRTDSDLSSTMAGSAERWLKISWVSTVVAASSSETVRPPPPVWSSLSGLRPASSTSRSGGEEGSWEGSGCSPGTPRASRPSRASSSTTASTGWDCGGETASDWDSRLGRGSSDCLSDLLRYFDIIESFLLRIYSQWTLIIIIYSVLVATTINEEKTSRAVACGSNYAIVRITLSILIKDFLSKMFSLTELSNKARQFKQLSVQIWSPRYVKKAEMAGLSC